MLCGVFPQKFEINVTIFGFEEDIGSSITSTAG